MQLSLQCGPTYAADILLVGSQSSKAETTFKMLVELGCDPYRVITVIDNQQAMIRFQQGPCDLIFMDFQLPSIDGFESVRSIRELERRHRKPSIPIVAFCGRMTITDRNLAEAAGVNDFLFKPFQISDLRDVIETYVN